MPLAFELQSGAACRTEGLLIAAVKGLHALADPGQHVCGRWNDAMESPTLKKEHWRKSGQWFVLNRRHVQIVVNDTEVAQAFKECVCCLLSSLQSTVAMLCDMASMRHRTSAYPACSPSPGLVALWLQVSSAHLQRA